MLTLSRRPKLTIPVGAALAATGLTLTFAAPSAGAQPMPAPAGHGKTAAAKNGDNGTVKIHRATTPVTDRRNEPHVCVFYLDAFGFDPAQAVTWQIQSWPPTGDRTVVDQGALALDSNGDGRTTDQTLPNGHYKLFWNFAGEHGAAKHKVFWVSCPSSTPTPKPTHPAKPTPTAKPTCTATPTPPVPTLSPAPSPTSSSSPAPPAPVPVPVHTTLPVTG